MPIHLTTIFVHPVLSMVFTLLNRSDVSSAFRNIGRLAVLRLQDIETRI